MVEEAEEEVDAYFLDPITRKRKSSNSVCSAFTFVDDYFTMIAPEDWENMLKEAKYDFKKDKGLYGRINKTVKRGLISGKKSR